MPRRTSKLGEQKGVPSEMSLQVFTHTLKRAVWSHFKINMKVLAKQMKSSKKNKPLPRLKPSSGFPSECLSGNSRVFLFDASLIRLEDQLQAMKLDHDAQLALTAQGLNDARTQTSTAR